MHLLISYFSSRALQLDWLQGHIVQITIDRRRWVAVTFFSDMATVQRLQDASSE